MKRRTLASLAAALLASYTFLAAQTVPAGSATPGPQAPSLAFGPDSDTLNGAPMRRASERRLGYWPVSEPILNSTVGWICFFSWIESLTAPTPDQGYAKPPQSSAAAIRMGAGG